MNTYLQVGLHAISDPTRLAILRRLAEEPLAVVELTRSFAITRPAISQHLRVLKDAGLVHDRHQGTQRIYQIDQAGIEALKAHFDSLWSSVLDSFQIAAESADTNPKPKENSRVQKSTKRAILKRR
jgi:DNA-binding transcriptional ArsR family regulator